MLEIARRAHEERYGRPDPEAGNNQPLAIQAISNESPHWAAAGINPHEDGHQLAELLGALQRHNVCFD